MTVVPEGCERDDAAAEREAGTNERPPPDAEPLEVGLGGAVLNQHNNNNNCIDIIQPKPIAIASHLYALLGSGGSTLWWR